MSIPHIKFINESNKIASIKGLKTDAKGLLAVTLLDLCNEHVRSIAHLLNLRFDASALALYRPAVEAFVRGSWVISCAETSQVQKLAEADGSWPKFERMVKEVHSAFDGMPIFNRYIGREYGLMNSFTHGLSHQILGRFDGRVMAFSLEDDQLEALYGELARLSFGANMQIAELAGNQLIIDKLMLLKSEAGI